MRRGRLCIFLFEQMIPSFPRICRTSEPSHGVSIKEYHTKRMNASSPDARRPVHRKVKNDFFGETENPAFLFPLKQNTILYGSVNVIL